jgi:DNA-binding transcriptional MerR regulator
MAKKRSSTPLGAAECARRTGLTVRALRVYERYGLIAPKRSARGWRIYDASDLIRLNAILALKRLGMTLTQIRQALTGNTPPLGRVLRVQLENSRARKADADKLIALIELALSRLRDRDELSINDLCALSVEQTDHWPLAAIQCKEVPVDMIKMKHYESSQWHFALDIPERWNSFPPVSSNSPAEVIRFQSHECGNHILIIFRHPCDPMQPMRSRSEQVRQQLAGKGFGNFVSGATTLGTRSALTLDFDRPQGDGTWSCRHCFVTQGTLAYTLGFGTTDKAGMFKLFDRIAGTFEILRESLDQDYLSA